MDEAARELRAGIADIERTGRSLTLAERRSGFLTDKWDVYVQLALLERARGRVGAAFEVSERIRASEMLELLGAGTGRRAAGHGRGTGGDASRTSAVTSAS